MKKEIELAIRARVTDLTLDAAYHPVSSTVRSGQYIADVNCLLTLVDVLRAENEHLATRR